MKNTIRKTGVVLFAAAALISACSTATTGGIKRSGDVTRAFEGLQLNADYRYWILNLENEPYGVVGLKRDYRIGGNHLWQPAAPESPVLQRVVGLVRSFPVPGSYTSGFHITDPQGRIIGVWYSSLLAGITVDPMTNEVSVSTAMPWVFNDNY